VGFDVTGQLLIIYSAFVKYLSKKWEYSDVLHQILVNFKKAYDSVRRELLNNILLTEVWHHPETSKTNKNVSKRDLLQSQSSKTSV
jgi:hypothetical protein